MQKYVRGSRCACLCIFVRGWVCACLWMNMVASCQASRCSISTTHSQFHLSPFVLLLLLLPLLISQLSVWPVFKWLQAPMKLDWVQCNEEHAREEYDIKWHTKHTPAQAHIRHMQKDTQTLVSLTKSNIKTCRQTCESFGRKTKSLFVNPFTFLTD